MQQLIASVSLGLGGTKRRRRTRTETRTNLQIYYPDLKNPAIHPLFSTNQGGFYTDLDQRGKISPNVSRKKKRCIPFMAISTLKSLNRVPEQKKKIKNSPGSPRHKNMRLEISSRKRKKLRISSCHQRRTCGPSRREADQMELDAGGEESWRLDFGFCGGGRKTPWTG